MTPFTASILVPSFAPICIKRTSGKLLNSFQAVFSSVRFSHFLALKEQIF